MSSITNSGDFVSNPELRRRGQEVWERLYAGGYGGEITKQHEAKSSDIADMSLEWAIGGLFARPGLDLRTRELVAVADCVVAGFGLGPVNDAVIAHAHGALRVGATKREIYEVILQGIWYHGAAPAHLALSSLKDFFGEDENSSPGQQG